MLVHSPARAAGFGSRFPYALLFGGLTLSAGFVAGVHAASATTQTNATPWSYSASLALKESYDDNVFLQDSGALGNHSSFVTTVLPQLGVTYSANAQFKAAFNYAPDISFYHSEHGEDFVAHKFALNLGGKMKKVAWDLANSFTWVEGAETNLVFTGQGGVPAAGGIPIRDRRDQWFYRNAFKLTIPLGDWFFRPTAATYIHDFRSAQNAAPGCQNYADRKDVSGGLDVGRKLNDKLSAFVGYRYGWQDQEQLFKTGSAYENHYHRALFGVEAVPCSWLKFSVTAGPDFREYDSLAACEPNRTTYFLDASLSVTPGKQDQITATGKSYEQPGFGGRSVYQDSTFELIWRHTFNSRWAMSLGGRAYNTDFVRPVNRNDWIYTGMASVSCRLAKGLNAELAYSFDDAQSLVANTPAREFTRSIVAAGLKYTFR